MDVDNNPPSNMKIQKMIALMLGSASLLCGVAQAMTVDTRDVSTPGPGTTYWTPAGSQTSAPYYRWWNQDWQWQHGAIAGTITTAALNVSAWDVDYDGAPGYLPERDEIFAYDAAASQWVSLGFLAGSNNSWAFTNFTLGANLLDDVGNGLMVKINIDTLNSQDTWAVSLAKSVITTEGANPGNPNPTVPDSGSMLTLFGIAGAALAGMRRFTR